MNIVDLKNDKALLKEYLKICNLEWGKPLTDQELESKVESKTNLILSGQNINIIAALGLIDGDNLIGFISLLKKDEVDMESLTPWYGTMFVKKEHRKKGHSRILNEAILKEAKKLNYNKVYLKTTLENYYEKFGAKYLLSIGNEKIYYFDI
jgi:predicted GNAT family N-acyltransferase